jgi:hemolysin D
MDLLPAKTPSQKHLVLLRKLERARLPKSTSSEAELFIAKLAGRKGSRVPAFAAFFCGFAAAAAAWSYSNYADAYAVVPGKVQFGRTITLIKPATSGRIVAIDVADGQHVKKGDVLAEIDPADAITEWAALQSKFLYVKAAINRYKSAIKAARAQTLQFIPVKWDDATPKAVQLGEEKSLRSDLEELGKTLDELSEQRSEALFRQDRAKLGVAAQRAYLDVLIEQYKMRDQLYKQNADSRMNVLNILKDLKRGEFELTSLESNVSDASFVLSKLDAQIAKAREGFIRENEQRLAETEATAGDLELQVANMSKRTNRITLSAPVNGIVKGAARAALGQMVSPSEQLIQLEPEDGERPEIVAYVSKQELPFVEPEQEAVIQMTSQLRGSYASISGKVTRIFHDSAPAPSSVGTQPMPSGPSGDGSSRPEVIYKVLVAPSSTTFNNKGQEIALTPGMPVSVEIKTDKRRLIDYLLAPIQMISFGSRPAPRNVKSGDRNFLVPA